MRRKTRKNKKLVLTSFILLICLAVGYSAFNTVINLKAKGNIHNKVDLCYTTSDNGDGTVTITDYDKTCGTEVKIPKTLKGKTVTKIGGGAFKLKEITKVIIPSTVTRIERAAFENNSINTLEIPSSVTYIGEYSFRHNKINSLILHEGLKSINLDAFQNNYISEINIPSSVTYLGGGTFAANSVTGENAFVYGRNSDGSIDYTTLDCYAGKDATGTTISDTVTTISREAYYTVKYLEIDVPARIKEIPPYCFNETNAKRITLHEGLEKIGENAFGLNWRLGEISIPSTVKAIGYEAFPVTLKTININKTENTITGAPWGATNAQINWNAK